MSQERQENGEIVWYLRQNPPDVFKKIITLGIYEGHAFLIKDIRKLAKLYGRRHCRARFTQAISLQQHGKTYTKGQKNVVPKWAGQSPADNIRESVSRQRGGVSSIDTLAGSHKLSAGEAYSSPFMWTRWREVDCRGACWRLWHENANSIPLSRQLLAWMCPLFPEW